MAGPQVDITVNNILAIVNTKLLADYVKLDERLLQLCCVVKHWAKRRQARPLQHRSACPAPRSHLLPRFMTRDARIISLEACWWDAGLMRAVPVQVNDSYRGTLSSYCYVLMCIHLLQQRQPAILPCLQSLKPATFQRWAALLTPANGHARSREQQPPSCRTGCHPLLLPCFQ